VNSNINYRFVLVAYKVTVVDLRVIAQKRKREGGWIDERKREGAREGGRERLHDRAESV